MMSAGANDDLEKNIAIANTRCSEFFAMMKKDKEQALLSPPFVFEVSLAAGLLPQSTQT